MPTPDENTHWMQLALEQASKGVGTTSPNPPVGAVIVKDGKVIGKGWHQKAGAPHAEREAIADALQQHPQEALNGASIYVTLEPCSSHGRTPPCTEGILATGITRVVYGSQDPNPKHAGAAKTIMQSAGLEVHSGVHRGECDKLIRPFTKVQKTGLPWVILKSAISLDGKTTRPPGEGQWLSSSESRQLVQNLRYQSDAIITGGNTLRVDNPSLTLRPSNPSNKEQPWRMIITRGKKEALPQHCQLFSDEHANRTLVQEQGDIISALKTLANKGCNSVLVEAGGTLMAAFLREALADELVVFYAPMLTGGDDLGFGELTPEVDLEEQQFTRIGSDIMLRATIKKTNSPQLAYPESLHKM